MKPIAKTLVAGGLLACSSIALAELSANVALTTDYVFRGVSQSNEDPAIQGGFDYSHGSGFYAGVWGSNVSADFYSSGVLELDTYFGYSGEAASLGYDAGFIRYNYPGSDPKADYDEVYVGVSYGMFSATYYRGVDTSNDDLGDYLDLAVDLELPQGFGLGLHLGDWNASGGGQDYRDYKIALSRDFASLSFELAYTDTDMNKTECANFSGNTGWCDGRVVLTVSKEM